MKKEENRECPWPMGISRPFGPSERNERRDARENRRQILEVAQRLFAEQGVENVSMHQIAIVAGIGQGTLYRHYRHKGELCMDLMYEYHQRFIEGITVFLAPKEDVPPHLQPGPLERLKGVLARMITFLEEQGTLLGQIAMTDHRAHGPRAGFTSDMPDRLSFFNWLHDLVAGLLNEAVTENELAPLDVPYTVQSIFATMNPLYYRFQRQECGFSVERILQGLYHIYIDGLKMPQEGEKVLPPSL